MSARYPSPAPLPSPPTEPPSSSAPIAPAQSANRTTSSLHPMSILSLITTDLPETPPDSRGSSSETNHATQAPLVPPPESITSPVNDSTLTVTDVEALTAAEQLYSMRSQDDANEHNESIATPAEDEPLNAALIDSPTATVKDKGKGKDPELYDISPPRDGNSQDCQLDRSATHNEAENGLQVPAITDEVDLAFVLLDLGANGYECKTCLDGDNNLCSQCLTVPWRQRARPSSPVSPSPVVKYEPNLYSSDSEEEGAAPLSTAHPVSPSPVVEYEPNLYSSDSEDEGPPPSACKIRFDPSCHGNCLQLSAHEGNAVFDLLPHRKQRHDSHHHDLEVSDGETRCRRCELVLAHIYVRYEQHYKVREYKRFERGDTVPLDDGAVAERHGAAEYDGSKSHGMMSSSNPPKLSRKTIRRLKAEKREWKPEPNPLISTVSDTPVSVANVLERTPLPRSAKRSGTRSSVTATTSINPEASLEQTANKSPHSPPTPSSDNHPPKTRPTYANHQSRASYPLASNYIDLATSISSSSYSPPTPRQPQQQNSKPFTPSPLKHALTAADWEQQQLQTPPTRLPTTTKTTTTMMDNSDKQTVLMTTPLSGPQSQLGGNNGRKTMKYFSPSPVKYIYGSIDQPTNHENKANHIPLLLTPPSISRKRKAVDMQPAAIQAAEVQKQAEEGQVEWHGKKFKGRAAVPMSVERERMRDALDALGAVGG